MRQLVTNQEEIFNMAFFSTVQVVLAGSDSQGLRYGTAGTPEQFFVEWKDESPPAEPAPGDLLDRPLAQLCNKTRLLDLIRNFVIFDAGHKKVPRPHQFFAVKAAQERVARREGGVIWHTQGSGKSILMVLDRQVASGARCGRPHPCHHGPRRTGSADRGRDEERRGHRSGGSFAVRHFAGAACREAWGRRAAPAVRAHP